jgi:hypothetical protein
MLAFARRPAETQGSWRPTLEAAGRFGGVVGTELRHLQAHRSAAATFQGTARPWRVLAAGLDDLPVDGQPDQGMDDIHPVVPIGERLRDGGPGAGHAVREQLQDGGRGPGHHGVDRGGAGTSVSGGLGNRNRILVACDAGL